MRYRRLAGAIVLSILPALAGAQTTSVDANNPSDNHTGQKAMSRVTGIGGIFLKAKDPAMLRAWYKTTLALTFRHGAARRFVGWMVQAIQLPGQPPGSLEMVRTLPQAPHRLWSTTGCPTCIHSWPRSVLKDVTYWKKPRNRRTASLAGSWILKAIR